MEQDLGLSKYGSSFITLEEYNSRLEEDKKFNIYKNVIYDLEDSEMSSFYDAWTKSA